MAMTQVLEVISLWYVYLPVYLVLLAGYIIMKQISLRRDWKAYFQKYGISTYQISAERITRAIHMGLISLSILISAISGLIFFFLKYVPVIDVLSIIPIFVALLLLILSMGIGLQLAYRVVTEEEGGEIKMDLSKIAIFHRFSIHFISLIGGVILLILFLALNSPLLVGAQQPKGGRIVVEEVLSPYSAELNKGLISGESADDVRLEVRIIVEERAKTQNRRPTPEDVEIALLSLCQVGGPPRKSDRYKQSVEEIRRKYIGISKDASLQERFRRSITEELKRIDRTRLNRFGILDDVSVFFQQ